MVHTVRGFHRQSDLNSQIIITDVWFQDVPTAQQQMNAYNEVWRLAGVEADVKVNCFWKAFAVVASQAEDGVIGVQSVDPRKPTPEKWRCRAARVCYSNTRPEGDRRI